MSTVKKYGIDVSYHQGVINWQQVKAAGVEFVVLRAGYGFSTVDTQFSNNIQGAIAAGFEHIGVYWFSYAGTPAHITQEVTSCLATIEPYREHINMPVWFDFEGASYTYVQNTYGVSLTPAQIRELAQTWCAAVANAGYLPGIYSNKSDGDRWFKTANGAYLWQTIPSCQYWYARYGANDETALFITPAFEQTALAEHPEMDILQYSDVGRINGINSTRVDLNIWYTQEETPEPPPPTPPEPEPEPEEPTYTDNMELVEVRGADFELIAVHDVAKSVIWHSLYYGVGDFEIYTQANSATVNLFQVDRYITRPNNAEVGIVEHVGITYNLRDGYMLTVTGRFAKSILDRRHIYQLSGTTNTPTTLYGNVETEVRELVSNNAIDCTDTARNIPVLVLGTLCGSTKRIIDSNGDSARKQVSYANLLTYSDSVLKEYGLSARVELSSDETKLQYRIFYGADRSSTNAENNEPVIFSRDFDNLTESEYTYDITADKNTALIGGEGEDLNRFYALLDVGASGLARRETWVDANNISRSYDDDGGEEQQYSAAEYTAMLNADGKQKLAEETTIETFEGELDIVNGNYVYGRDFELGDIVTVQDTDIGKYINVRITEVTEVQDENGYTINIDYGAE